MVAPRGSTAEPRAMTIEGQRVLVVERTPPLPRKLPDLLASMAVTAAWRVDLLGATTACEALREHRFVKFREGRFFGLDLLLEICRFCGAVCVRDVSYDTAIEGEAITRTGAPRRRDHILGWYSGSRRNAREFK